MVIKMLFFHFCLMYLPLLMLEKLLLPVLGIDLEHPTLYHDLESQNLYNAHHKDLVLDLTLLLVLYRINILLLI